MSAMTGLHEQLCRYDAGDWARAIDSIAANIAAVDRDATRIWFAFYPLKLAAALAAAGDRDATVRKLGLMGRWGLTDSVDTSHQFLFGHRHWSHVKRAMATVDHAASPLGALVTQVADMAASSAGTDRDHTLGISAVGLMTLRQVGPDVFALSNGQTTGTGRSERQILKARTTDDSQGLFGFLRGVRKRWTVTFDENDPAATFVAMHEQELASAAQTDKREYRSRDVRCTPDEGPIPVECRSASCGTCWVGVLGGASKLAPVDAHEAKRMRVFGYADLEVGSQPIIRLACQARVTGAVSIVIPPWNGFISRL
jgi:ferredoxin